MDNNQDDIRNFVNRFKKYIKFIIINSSINYSKKIKLRRKREIELDDIDNLIGMEITKILDLNLLAINT